MTPNKIIPSIWFNAQGGEIENVISYYKNIFQEDFQAGQVIPLGNTPSGKTQMCQVSIFGQKYS